ncbi:hypothetical protein HJC23_012444 [Cyclotella cryptica]|uniref:Uncharacterized protein n=1 Tax=Cyclotella cryptica TaxID=29204 RepID=A0ABD3NTJ7_9STRA
MPTNIHTRHTGNLPDPTPQLLIARGHNKTSPLRHHHHQTIIGITPLTIAGNLFKARILRHTQGHFVFRSEFFEFSHDAVYDAGDAFGEDTVHHGSYDFHFVRNGKVDEVRVDEDVVGRSELIVVLEEEGGDGLVDVSGFDVGGFFGGLLFLYLLFGFGACVFRADYLFGHSEFAGLFGFPHKVPVSTRLIL